MTESKKIGTSPAGVEWIAYRKTTETDDDFAAKVATMTARLAELAKKHTVTARKIAPAGMARIVDLLDRMYESKPSPFAVKATVISGPRGAMAELADALEDDVHPDEVEFEIAGGSLDDLTDAQIAFGVRAAMKSVESAVRALRRAK